MSDKQPQAPKTKFALLLDWASKDRVCAMAICLALIANFPHLASFILDFATLLLPAVATATGLK